MKKVRMQIRANPKLRLELLGVISKKLREFGVDISDSDLLKVTLCREDELTVQPEQIDPPTVADPIADPPMSPKKRRRK